MTPRPQCTSPAGAAGADVAAVSVRLRCGRRRIGFSTGVLAAVLTTAWHVFWVVAFAPRPNPPHRGVPRPPRLVFATTTAGSGDMQLDARALWSPILFSLPTPVGFSQPVLDGRIGASPPLVGEGPSSQVMFDEGRFVSIQAVQWPWQLEDWAEARLFQVNPPALDEPAFRLPAGSEPTGLRVEWSGEWNGRHMGKTLRLKLPKGADARAWEITACVETDERGGVKHVFLESASPFAEVNRAVEQALREVRFEPGPPVPAGRVVIGSLGKKTPLVPKKTVP